MKKTLKILTLVGVLVMSSFAVANAEETEISTLYNDGTLIINELEANQAENVIKHGIAIKTYNSVYTHPWQSDEVSKYVIKAVEFGSPTQPTDMSNWFYGCTGVTSFDFTNLDTSKCTNFYRTFRGVGTKYLTTPIKAKWNLNFGDLDVSSAVTMQEMFYETSVNTTDDITLDLSSWNTSKVTNMKNMFYSFAYNSSGDVKINLKGWDFSSVTDMTGFMQNVAKQCKSFDLQKDDWDLRGVIANNAFNSLGSGAAAKCDLGILYLSTDKAKDRINNILDAAKNVVAKIYISGPELDPANCSPFDGAATGSNGNIELIVTADKDGNNLANAKIWAFNCMERFSSLTNSGKSSQIRCKGVLIVPPISEKFTYTGEKITPNLVILDDGTICEFNKDYTLEYANNLMPGTGTVTITGIGDYAGQVTQRPFNIAYRDIVSFCNFSLEYSKVLYDGLEKKPSVKVTSTIDNSELVEGQDYTVKYSNNTAVGNATVSIIGITPYTNTKKLNFEIYMKDLKNATITYDKSYYYTGDAVEPEPVVVFENKTLEKDKDYTLTYYDNVDPTSNAYFTVAGKGEYSGIVQKTFSIKANTFAQTLSQTSFDFTGEPCIPEITVKNIKGEIIGDYETKFEQYDSNKAAWVETDCIGDITQDTKIRVVSTGTGIYKYGTPQTTTYLIKKANTAKTAFTISDVTYNGKEQTPEVKHNILKEGVDFETYNWSNNMNAGTAAVSIKGIGKFEGSFNHIINFKINKAVITSALITRRYAVGKSKIIPVARVYADKDLVDASSYTVSATNNVNAGIAQATFKGTGNYTGTLVRSFVIQPAHINSVDANLSTVSAKYTGKKIVPKVVVNANTAYYDISYAGSFTKKGTHYITIKGKGNYYGKRVLKFTIY